MLILSTLEIFLTWLVVAIALIGLGSLLLSRFTLHFSPTEAFWMGLAVSVAVLEIWNLFLPLTLSITLLLFAAGILGLAFHHSILRNSLRAAWQSSRTLVFLGLAFTLLLALRSCGPCEYYDTGLYGAQSVRWIATYPAVPGLAHLHGRLGFNSSVFLCIAALGHGLWKDWGFHLFTGFLLAAFWTTLLPACARILRNTTNSPASAADWFHTILALPAFFWTTRSRIVGTQTDEPATIVALIAAGVLFQDFSQNHREDPSPPRTARLILAAALFSLAVTFKESTAVFALLAWCLVFRRIWQSSASPQRPRHLAAALFFSSALILPWLARSILLSGYPLYPATLLALRVPWRIPLSGARWYALGVQSWGRIPDGSYRDTRGLLWLGDWLHHAIRNRPSFQVPVAIAFVGLAIALILLYRGGKSRPACPWLALLLPSFAGIIFWFAASPDLRFAQFAIWTAAATLGTWGVLSLENVSLEIVSLDLQRRPAFTRTALAALALSIVWCVISFGWREPIDALRGVRQPPPLPKPALVTKHTASGLAVYVPAQGNQCWDAPLPCTPYFDESLRPRDESSLRWGFTSEGRATELHTFW